MTLRARTTRLLGAILAVAFICGGCAVRRVPVGAGPPFLRAAGMRRVSDLRAITPPAWSPHGRRIAFGTAEAVWSVRQTGGEPPPRRLAALAGAERVAWLPGGQSIAVLADGRLWQVETDDPSPRALLSAHGIRQFAWDPDLPPGRGWRVAYVAQTDGGPALHIARENPRGKTDVAWRAGLPASGADVRTLTWLAGGAGIAVALAEPAGADRLVVVSPGPRGGARIRTFAPGGRAPLPSPAGRFVAYLDGRRVAVVRGDGTGRRVLTDAGHYTALAWSPSGTLLAFARENRSRVALEVADVLTGERIRIGDYRPEIASSTSPLALVWAPDGMRLAFGTDTGAAPGFVWVATLERR